MESEVTAVATIITQSHRHIGENYVDRIRGLLSRNLTIKKYALNDERWEDVEAISFEVDENTTLEISLKRRK